MANWKEGRREWEQHKITMANWKEGRREWEQHKITIANWKEYGEHIDNSTQRNCIARSSTSAIDFTLERTAWCKTAPETAPDSESRSRA